MGSQTLTGGKVFRRCLGILACGVLLAACSGSTTSSNDEAVATACTVVNGWPADFAELWPATLTNAVERGDSAGQSMREYVEGTHIVQDMTNATVRQILEDYARYWELLEEDWRAAVMRGDESAPVTGPAADLLQRLQEQCRPYEDS